MPQQFNPSDPRSYDPYYEEQLELGRFKALPSINPAPLDSSPQVTSLPEGIASRESNSLGSSLSQSYNTSKTKRDNKAKVPDTKDTKPVRPTEPTSLGAF